MRRRSISAPYLVNHTGKEDATYSLKSDRDEKRGLPKGGSRHLSAGTHTVCARTPLPRAHVDVRDGSSGRSAIMVTAGVGVSLAIACGHEFRGAAHVEW